MDSSQSASFVGSLGGDFEWLGEIDSTNTELLRRRDATHFSVIATDNQVAGRGRAGRTWQAPAGACLAISVLLKPKSALVANLGWLPLLAGLAMTQTVRQVIDKPVGVKWPNDVLVGEQKISGILSELAGDLSTVVIGAGLNVSLTEQQLPVPTATSLTIETGNDFALDDLLLSYLKNLEKLYRDFENADFDASASGLRAAVTKECLTLGRQVKAILPADQELIGRAVAIDETGRLVIEVNHEAFAVAAGDIVHMRHN